MKRFEKIAVIDFQYSDIFYNGLKAFSDSAIVRLDKANGLIAKDMAKIDALVCSWKDTIDAAFLNSFPNLKHIAIRSTSTKNIDLEYIQQRGITLTNIQNYGDQATAEFVLQQIFALACDYTAPVLPMEVSGKSVGFLGFGHVAKRVAPALLALGAKLSYYTPSEEETRQTRNGVPYASKNSILRSDFLCVHTPDRLESLNLAELQKIPARTNIIITTMGLPFSQASLYNWKKSAPNIVIMDKVAAENNNLSRLKNVHVVEVYAARSQESKKNAEKQLLEGLRKALTILERSMYAGKGFTAPR